MVSSVGQDCQPIGSFPLNYPYGFSSLCPYTRVSVTFCLDYCIYAEEATISTPNVPKVPNVMRLI